MGWLPTEYEQVFEVLLDVCPAKPLPEITAIIEAELGRPASDVFESIEEKPLGAASIGQVRPLLTTHSFSLARALFLSLSLSLSPSLSPSLTWRKPSWRTG